MATDKEEAFLKLIRRKLGPDYMTIIIDVFMRYRIATKNPLTLHKKLYSEFALNTALNIPLQNTTAKYFYLKAAATTQPDVYDMVSSQLLKYEAYRGYLQYNKSAGIAASKHLFSIGLYQPSELSKLCLRLRNTFRFDISTGPVKRAVKITIIDPGFTFEDFEKAQPQIDDPFKDSDDDEPIPPKPIMTEPPNKKKYSVIEDESPDWSQVRDEFE